MTTTQTSIDHHDGAERLKSLELALAEHLEHVLEYAAGGEELLPGDFEATLVSVRHLAAEIRWLTLGAQPVPF